jgi:hypothetical protein
LASFKHFLINERDREHALKRGGGQRLLAFDLESAEARYAAEPADAFTPESLFERQWALGILDRGMATLRAECASAGKSSTFAHLEAFIMGDKSPVVNQLSGLPGIRIDRLDAYRLLNDIVANPAGFGLTNATTACITPDVAPFFCQAPDTFLFWDGIHPTRAAHALIAAEAAFALSQW